jgi:hypothetical protein
VVTGVGTGFIQIYSSDDEVIFHRIACFAAVKSYAEVTACVRRIIVDGRISGPGIAFGYKNRVIQHASNRHFALLRDSRKLFFGGRHLDWFHFTAMCKH